MTTAPRQFCRERRIRFDQCDPAGIVFFPQYQVMFVALIEDFIVEQLGISYADLIAVRRVGLPTVSLACEFRHPSRMGDRVTLGLAVARLGNRSIALAMECRDAERVRVAVRQTIVTTSLDTHRSIPIPADLRAAIEAFDPALRGAPAETTS